MSRATVIVVGAGGNIGSHLVPHLARLTTIGRLVLVDRDVYERRNRWNQDAPRGATGLGKAAVQAQRARRINPALPVDARRADVETMPMGHLRGDLILSALDSRRARQAVNQAARRLGVPWIDAGVHGDGTLARVTGYTPAEDAPCLECGWDQADYAALEQRYPCGGRVDPAPTAAPSSLGALAASLLAIECDKRLSADRGTLEAGTSVVLDAAHHRHFVTTTRRNLACRLPGHGPWSIIPYAGWHRSLDELLELGRHRLGGEPSLRVAGHPFLAEAACMSCGRMLTPWRLAGRLPAHHRRCPRCRGPLTISGFGQTEYLERTMLPPRAARRPLRRFGLRPGDVVSLSAAEQELHVELVRP